ncbi:MAG: hypothetical protein JRD68_10260 [Deltaproteobacteria bacterium]|nr:hypothetical protein [Deltaproteobacteria bacterium]
MIAHFQCVIVEHRDTSFKAVLPREVRVRYTKYGPRPLPKSIRDQRYFSVSAPFKDFESPDDFLEAVGKCLDKCIQDGEVMGLEELRNSIEAECGFRVGEVERTMKFPQKTSNDFLDLDEMFEGGKYR